MTFGDIVEATAGSGGARRDHMRGGGNEVWLEGARERGNCMNTFIRTSTKKVNLTYGTKEEYMRIAAIPMLYRYTQHHW